MIAIFMVILILAGLGCLILIGIHGTEETRKFMKTYFLTQNRFNRKFALTISARIFAIDRNDRSNETAQAIGNPLMAMTPMIEDEYDENGTTGPLTDDWACPPDRRT